jgi:hypothetical protein
MASDGKREEVVRHKPGRFCGITTTHDTKVGHPIASHKPSLATGGCVQIMYL